ncbi:hypothetical protein EV179_004830 [Coemansia sp. RSA 487]|nr:hypothetical protein LPJ74_005900 [Coemansia sp. RSA 1843]KAJ2088584.1 hypothetical protein IW138_004074 [Coemansia sp. RSA 986]KAJ2212203.1 hypothetical protein EV179_004830 [Coemansia sp. RSA 487]
MFSCQRITLLSCCQIQPPPRAVEERRLGPLSSPTSHLLVEPENKRNVDEKEEVIFNAWGPLSAAPLSTTGARHGQKHKRPKAEDDPVNCLWLCPEIDRRVRVDNARRLKALRVAERMDAMVQAAKKRDESIKGQIDAEKRSGGGAKRESLETKPDYPYLGRCDTDAGNQLDENASLVQTTKSLELVKPQSLLIPELLPKELMLRSTQPKRTQHPALLSSSPVAESHEATCQSQHPKPKDADVEMSEDPKPDLGLDLGLDLGFSVSKRGAAAHRGPHLLGEQEGTSLSLDIAGSRSAEDDGVSASILEITSFLERDVDVFTPLSANMRTPRTSAFADPLSSPATATLFSGRSSWASSNPKIDTTPDTVVSSSNSTHQELIDDILGIKF